MQKDDKNKKSGKKIEPKVDPNAPVQDQYQKDAGPIPALTYTTTIDLTKDSRPAKQLVQATKALRESVLTNRKNEVGPRSLTYEVKSSSFTVWGVRGHRKLAKRPNTKQKHDKVIEVKQGDRVSLKDQTITARLTISIDGIYPQSMGYAFIQKAQKQCYHIWINGYPCTLIGVNYPQYVEDPTKLTDVLGILIAEQIRFNTLDLFHKAFPEIEELSTFQLYQRIFENFKKRLIYNGWKHKWNQELSEQYKIQAFKFEIGWRLQQAQRVNYRILHQYEKIIAGPENQDQHQRIQREKQWREKQDYHIYDWMQGESYKSQMKKLLEQAIQVENKRIFILNNEKVQVIPPNSIFKQGNRILKSQEIRLLNEERKKALQLLKAEGVREFEQVKVEFREVKMDLYVEKLVKHRGQPDDQ